MGSPEQAPDAALAFEERIQAVRHALPDYPGLALPEERRASDEAVCGRLGAVVSDFLEQVGSLEAHLSRRGPVHLRDRVREAEDRIDMLREKIQSAPYRFSPFFSAREVPVETQARMIGNDAAALDAAGRIRRLLEPTLRDDADLKALADEIEGCVRDLDERLEARLTTLLELG